MKTASRAQVGLTIFCGRAGDHNNLAMSGAQTVGNALTERLGIPASLIGKPEPALNTSWQTELDAASPSLFSLAAHLDTLLKTHVTPLIAMNRCAVAMSTLPVVMHHFPEACVVWIDAHGDLNTPRTSSTGYLGGMPLAAAAGLWDSGLGNGLPLENVVLVGSRDLDTGEMALIKSGKVRLVSPGPELITQLRTAIDGRPIYIHLDCDVLEPGIVPTNYRVPGGLTLDNLHAASILLAEYEILGLEIAEFENAWSENAEAVSPSVLLDALEPLINRLESTSRLPA